FNMKFTRGASCTGAVGNGTVQLWLFETTGVIESVYTALPASVDGGYSVGLQSGAATNFAAVTTAGGGSVSYVAGNDTQTTATTAGNAEIFTPQVATAPSGLNFTGTTGATTTLNWADNSGNEVGFAVYRSDDGGTTYSFITQTAANATSFGASSVATAAISGPTSSHAATTASSATTPQGAGGLWIAPATWAGGTVPG